jgi:hypothetical protein
VSPPLACGGTFPISNPGTLPFPLPVARTSCNRVRVVVLADTKVYFVVDSFSKRPDLDLAWPDLRRRKRGDAIAEEDDFGSGRCCCRRY